VPPLFYIGRSALFFALQPERARRFRTAIRDYLAALSSLQAQQPDLYQRFNENLAASLVDEVDPWAVDKLAFSVGRAVRTSSRGGSSAAVIGEFFLALTIQQFLDLPSVYARAALRAARPLARDLALAAQHRETFAKLVRVLRDAIQLLQLSTLKP
jgi:hypothetical protein